MRVYIKFILYISDNQDKAAAGGQNMLSKKRGKELCIYICKAFLYSLYRVLKISVLHKSFWNITRGME